MIPEQEAELALLRLCSPFGKFAIAIGARMSGEQQGALERLQARRWISLIDVTPLSIGEPGAVFRIFLLNEPAVAWLRLVEPGHGVAH